MTVFKNGSFFGDTNFCTWIMARATKLQFRVSLEPILNVRFADQNIKLAYEETLETQRRNQVGSPHYWYY